MLAKSLVNITDVKMLPGNDQFLSADWYVGYKHDIEIHYENDIWKIKDVKYHGYCLL